MAVMRLFEKFPATRGAMEQLAVSRFASALAAYTASGVNTDVAMREAIEVVEHSGLRAKAQAAYGLMIDPTAPRSLAQAISEACSGGFSHHCRGRDAHFSHDAAYRYHGIDRLAS